MCFFLFISIPNPLYHFTSHIYLFLFFFLAGCLFVCIVCSCVYARNSREINLRNGKVFNAHWQNCENTRWKCLCIIAQLCTGYMECSLCHDQSWAAQLKIVYNFSCAYVGFTQPHTQLISLFNGVKNYRR